MNIQEKFYENGLRFSCVRCSRCCRIEPGYVFLSHRDISRLSANLSITREQFVETYCRIIRLGSTARYSLKEKDNYDCILWSDGGCTAYEARPLQCSTYPFWPANLTSEAHWNALAETCPGINRGRLYTKQEIQDLLDLRMREPLISC